MEVGSQRAPQGSRTESAGFQVECGLAGAEALTAGTDEAGVQKGAPEIRAVGKLRIDSNDFLRWFTLGWRRAGMLVAQGKVAARDGTVVQQSHSWVYTHRKPEFQKIHAVQCSLQHCLPIARTWKQPKCPSTEEWIKIWYIYIVEYCSAIKGMKLYHL